MNWQTRGDHTVCVTVEIGFVSIPVAQNVRKVQRVFALRMVVAEDARFQAVTRERGTSTFALRKSVMKYSLRRVVLRDTDDFCTFQLVQPRGR